MSRFIDRLFNHRVKSISQELSDENELPDLFGYLLSLGTESARLVIIRSKIESFQFPEETYLKNLCILQFYLDLERYLIIHDSRYINTEEKLRSEIKYEFPEFGNSDAFVPLYHKGKSQEIRFAQLYILTLLKKFKDEDPDRQATQTSIEELTAKLHQDQPNQTLVEQINYFRRIKEEAFAVHKEFGEVFGQDFVDSVFAETQMDFNKYFERIDAVSCISDVIPQLFSSLLQENNTPKIVFPSANEERPDIPDQPQQQTSAIQNDVLENLLDGYLLFDEHGTLLECNSLGAKIFERSKNEILNQDISNLFPAYISDKIKQDIARLYDNSKKSVIGRRIEIDLVKSNGKKETYEVSTSNNYTAPVESFTLLLRNISKRKDTLKARISAEKAAEAKSTFLSNMSHEIRTPLNVILGLSEIISKNGTDNPEILHKNIEGIAFSAKNLLSIVNDILDFSKIEAGKLSLQSIDFNLREVVYNLANGFEIKAREKGLSLSAHIDDQIPNVVVGDQFRLNQILTNLVGNAIKFTHKGSILIEVKLESQNNEELWLNFRVADTGIGIPEEKIQTIFDSFYQVESPENAKINGTGLGLAITKELISLKKGKLNAKSQVGKGSEFYFSISFKKSTLKKLDNNSQPNLTKNKSLEGLKVLVAEDNKMNQFYIKQLLSSFGVEVDIAENGEEAVRIHQSGKVDYDLILMDMHMPVMNGLEAIASIRQSNKDAIKKVPIVACSADVFPESRKKAINAGIDFYLTKPLKEEALKEVLFWLVDEDKNLQLDSLLNSTPSDSDISKKSQSLDIAHLLDIFDNDRDFVISLLEVFIQETPDDLKSLRKCVEQEYYLQASTTAHKMKSSFMNLGMTRHGHHLQQIESLIKDASRVTEAKTHLKAFEELYKKALTEVNVKLIELKTKKTN
ncbi:MULTISPECIES: ATP-binding protein [unclassified Leeuwenhoekiella]|uniref:ATP-binding protein n=1 Tax=unclassified Leeuwenhoekiella TaxID=2615029 RepID=UPI000C658E67|nr:MULTISPECIES: ATP-binding protein [unclassified Leeuwenhoekiella]MAW93953.1 hypothetical protein [Leeuwenhoekiella sp.]MBA81008.1 hypothetical protein [Leeuwenhoekiella sp.]|tara:strand:+ start:50352 stop:53084 length:2733 start_codon:yes stop_codon:yes gene_type:complete